MWNELEEGADLFSACWNAPIERICVENPVMHKHAKARIKNFRPAAQTVQPWWFGDPAFKATGLYLRNLPKLRPTKRLTPPPQHTEEHKAWSSIHRASPGPDRWKVRSRTFPGLAQAMADQWGCLELVGSQNLAGFIDTLKPDQEFFIGLARYCEHKIVAARF